jgi:hypothetical protein
MIEFLRVSTDFFAALAQLLLATAVLVKLALIVKASSKKRR